MLINPKVSYYTTHADGLVQVFSKVDTDFGGPAHNFIAEKNTEEEAEELITKLKALLH